MDRQTLPSCLKYRIPGGDGTRVGESLNLFIKPPGQPRGGEGDCFVAALWTLAWVPASAHIHQTRSGSSPKEGSLEGGELEIC